MRSQAQGSYATCSSPWLMQQHQLLGQQRKEARQHQQQGQWHMGWNLDRHQLGQHHKEGQWHKGQAPPRDEQLYLPAQIWGHCQFRSCWSHELRPLTAPPCSPWNAWLLPCGGQQGRGKVLGLVLLLPEGLTRLSGRQTPVAVGVEAQHAGSSLQSQPLCSRHHLVWCCTACG